MTYTLLTGRFVIRYPDLPRQGPEPDGDTVKFRPDTPALVEGLPRPSGSPPDLTARGISVRLEAIPVLQPMGSLVDAYIADSTNAAALDYWHRHWSRAGAKYDQVKGYLEVTP